MRLVPVHPFLILFDCLRFAICRLSSTEPSSALNLMFEAHLSGYFFYLCVTNNCLAVTFFANTNSQVHLTGYIENFDGDEDFNGYIFYFASPQIMLTKTSISNSKSINNNNNYNCNYNNNYVLNIYNNSNSNNNNINHTINLSINQ